MLAVSLAPRPRRLLVHRRAERRRTPSPRARAGPARLRRPPPNLGTIRHADAGQTPRQPRAGRRRRRHRRDRQRVGGVVGRRAGQRHRRRRPARSAASSAATARPAAADAASTTPARRRCWAAAPRRAGTPRHRRPTAGGPIVLSGARRRPRRRDPRRQRPAPTVRASPSSADRHERQMRIEIKPTSPASSPPPARSGPAPRSSAKTGARGRQALAQDRQGPADRARLPQAPASSSRPSRRLASPRSARSARPRARRMSAGTHRRRPVQQPGRRRSRRSHHALRRYSWPSSDVISETLDFASPKSICVFSL